MYALAKKLFVTSERGHPVTELPARRESLEDGEIQTGKTEHAFEKSLPRIRQTLYTSKYVELGPDSVQGCKCFVSQLVTERCTFKVSAASPVAESIAELSLICTGKRTRLLPLS